MVSVTGNAQKTPLAPRTRLKTKAAGIMTTA